MPNWAYGSVSITGTKQNIFMFANRFICEDDEDNPTQLRKQKFFARSFVQSPRQVVHDDIEIIFSDIPANIVGEFPLDVEFAWSAHCCLIDGYPQKFPTECITLVDACKEDHVSVEIITEEGGMCFEEYITCDEHGHMTSESKELVQYECPNCGTMMGIASFIDTNGYSCYECGECGLKPANESGGDDHALLVDGA